MSVLRLAGWSHSWNDMRHAMVPRTYNATDDTAWLRMPAR